MLNLAKLVLEYKFVVFAVCKHMHMMSLACWRLELYWSVSCISKACTDKHFQALIACAQKYGDSVFNVFGFSWLWHFVVQITKSCRVLSFCRDDSHCVVACSIEVPWEVFHRCSGCGGDKLVCWRSHAVVTRRQSSQYRCMLLRCLCLINVLNNFSRHLVHSKGYLYEGIDKEAYVIVFICLDVTTLFIGNSTVNFSEMYTSKNT